MGSIRIPEMLTPEMIKALAGNVYTVNDESVPKEEAIASGEERFKPDNKFGKKKEKEHALYENTNDIDICCQKKVKFILVLNNAVVINVNAANEEDRRPA